MSEVTRRERQVARRHGGRAQPASGSIDGFKRDVRSHGEFLMEHKEVGGDYYRFDIRDFQYLVRQCHEPLPVYLIEFVIDRHHPVYIIPRWAAPEDAVKGTNNIKYWGARIRPERLSGHVLHFEKLGVEVFVADKPTYLRALEEVTKNVD